MCGAYEFVHELPAGNIFTAADNRNNSIYPPAPVFRRRNKSPQLECRTVISVSLKKISFLQGNRRRLFKNKFQSRPAENTVKQRIAQIKPFHRAFCFCFLIKRRKKRAQISTRRIRRIQLYKRRLNNYGIKHTATCF